ncbi:MAG: glycosyltransferase family 9 protein [Ignavibacteriaceae bacterium]|nr:glycosyltransferase family 9 protein [Ignavibacteriaceae bacterium]
MIKDVSELKKILIIRLSSMGDILLTTPLIRSIKRQNPEVQIDFVLKEEFIELVKNNPNLTDIHVYSKQSFEKQILINTLISNNYEIVIDLQNNIRSKEITKQMQCQTFLFKKNDVKKFLLVNFKINRLKNAPPIPVRYAEAAGINLDDEGLDIFTDNVADSSLDLNEKYIGLCPGAKHFSKRWPKEYFIELGKQLENSGYKVVLFGGLNEEELMGEIANHLSSPLSLCGDSILQSAADMKMCKAIYTNDSGAMHLACAVKVPVIAFFGSTVKEFGFFPYKANSIELDVENLPCRPCTHIGRKSCPLIHFKCMKDIRPDLAFSSLNRLLV